MADRRQVRTMALKAVFAVPLLLWSNVAQADPIDRWAPEIALASTRFGIPEAWVRRVMRMESGGVILLHGQPIVSRAGAMGLMQLMPGTWNDMRALLRLGPDPHDPHDNILAGTAYLRLMYDRFGYPGLFAAYNAGPARYAASLSGARPLAAETRAYVAAVAGAPPKRSAAAARPTSAIFLVTASSSPASVSIHQPPESVQPALFVPLSDQRPR